MVRPATLDPARARTLEELLVASQVFRSLTGYDPSTLAPIPSVAASWQASVDQRQWDFSVSPAARFSDGHAEKAIMAQLPVLPIARYEVPAVIGDRGRNLDPTQTAVFDSAQVWLAS